SSATGIQHAVSGKCSGERVTGDVLAPEVVVYLTGNDSFAGELSHVVLAPEAILISSGSTRCDRAGEYDRRLGLRLDSFEEQSHCRPSRRLRIRGAFHRRLRGKKRRPKGRARVTVDGNRL